MVGNWALRFVGRWRRVAQETLGYKWKSPTDSHKSSLPNLMADRLGLAWKFWRWSGLTGGSSTDKD